MRKDKIAIIVLWFGPLPAYFPEWLCSAEMNPDVDFFLFVDQEVKCIAKNINIMRTTKEAEVLRAEKELGETVTIKDAYKFCDLRPFFGLVYKDFLKEYDFWGYCDIDLVFGDIRKFLTDAVLEKHDRLYEWGPLTILRNTEEMKHLFDMPGNLYSRDEALRSRVKVFAEEHHGLNRVCRKNKVSWYREPDMADFYICYSDFLLWDHRLTNYKHQVFYWENGRAYRAAVNDEGQVVTDEYIYIHWQKRKPSVANSVQPNNAFYIFPNRIVKKEPGIPDKEQIIQLTPVVSKYTHWREYAVYVVGKLMEFVNSPLEKKRIWIRQKWTSLIETGSIMAQHSAEKAISENNRAL